MPSFIEKMFAPEAACYLEEVPYYQVNCLFKQFPRSVRDNEYWWLIKENYNNTELCWD